MLDRLGIYSLNQPVDNTKGLIEFTPQEYSMFEAAGYKRYLENERIYHGIGTSLNGSSWDTWVGTTNDKIYKISLGIVDTDRKNIENTFKETLGYLNKEMGKYTNHTVSKERDVYYWYLADGNTIYEKLNRLGLFCINIFVTSNSIRKQMFRKIGFKDFLRLGGIILPFNLPAWSYFLIPLVFLIAYGDIIGFIVFELFLLIGVFVLFHLLKRNLKWDHNKQTTELTDDYLFGIMKKMMLFSIAIGIISFLYFLLFRSIAFFLALLFAFGVYIFTALLICIMVVIFLKLKTKAK